jgi:RNA polymerase sigma-70 factor (ECF subfamily)
MRAVAAERLHEASCAGRTGKMSGVRRSTLVDCAIAAVTVEASPTTARDRAFATAVREHEVALDGIARRLCGNTADADDLVQETYERALRGWDRYADRGNLRSWLAAILHNLFVDRCRKAKRAPRLEGIDELEVPAPEAVVPPPWARVTPTQVTAALDRIGAEFRIVYELHTAGRSYDEIARELGIAKNTVGTRLIRARRKLKEILVRDLEGQP